MTVRTPAAVLPVLVALDVVLLAVLRSDVLDEDQLGALDEVLGRVHERLG